MAILRHESATGAHWDCLFSRVTVPPGADLLGAAGDAGKLLAYRIGSPITFAAGQSQIDLIAEPMIDHRLRYLAYEGDIGGGRGVVARVAQGRCAIESDRIRFVLDAVPGFFTWSAARTVGRCAVTIVRTGADDALDLAAPPNR